MSKDKGQPLSSHVSLFSREEIDTTQVEGNLGIFMWALGMVFAGIPA